MDFPAWREFESDEFTQVYDLSFPSAYTSHYPENNTVRVRAFVPNGLPGPFPSVVILHYWGATDLSLEYQTARELTSRGIAGIVMTLPFHLSRTPKGTRSGELALQADPERLVASMTQSVLDLRRTVDWITSKQEFDKEKIGLAGTSLGGIVASLAFGIEQRFRYGSFVLAGADLAGILWNSSRVVAQREDMRRRGYTEERLRDELRAIEPTKYLPGSAARPTLVIAAKLDTVVPPNNARILIGALGQPETVWLSTGHFGGALVRNRIIRTVAGFFDSSVRGQKFEAPASIHAPTLRFGLVYSDHKGLQFALSTDIWHADRKGNVFASALVTPQGPQAFAGFRMTENLAAGVLLFPNRTTLGVTWNVAF